MILRYFYDDKLAQASYLVGCARTHEALIVDPGRDIQPYLHTAQEQGLHITHVTETHIHADFASGSRELAAATGARVLLSGEGGDDWQYGWSSEPNVTLVREGDVWMVGNIKIEVLQTPGHTPEHICFLLTDTAGADRPMGLFSGDFIFAGDVGRPDLLEEAAGLVGTKEVGARAQFHSLQRAKSLPDYLQIWPGHGAGSACGKALGAIPSTTLGYEKLFNPAFAIDTEDAFVEWLLDGQPEAPRYFARMKHINKVGPVLLADLDTPAILTGDALAGLLEEGAQVFDLRPSDAYAQRSLRGTLSIPATSNAWTTWAGWFVDYARPLYLVLSSQHDLAQTLVDLRAIGIDDVGGVFTPDAIGTGAHVLPTLRVEGSARLPHDDNTLELDVRGRSEFEQEPVAGALNIPLGLLPARIAQLPRNRRIVTRCASGYRAQIAASLLRANGFHDVVVITSSAGD